MKTTWKVMMAIAMSGAANFAGCTRDDMADQPKYHTYGTSRYFANGAAARPLVDGTVTREGQVNHDETLAWANPVDENAGFPFALTRNDLLQGQKTFSIYCTPCHGQLGDGQGMIVRRGFTAPPTYHQERLWNAAPGHFYNVITHGWGAMYSQNDHVRPEDRWRVAAYIKALQLSQHVATDALTAEDRQKLEQAR